MHGRIENIALGQGVRIENIGSLICSGRTSFGNGVKVAVINEGGGRELPITTGTTSQLAYLFTLYRHRPLLIKQLSRIFDEQVDDLAADRGSIGDSTTILNCPWLENISTGNNVEISGADRLVNGTIEAHSHIGDGVIANDFIVLAGAELDSGAIIDKTLIGEGSRIGKQFSAENSAFFANCEGFHSEACSVFAGPYTVTHHRSTLLIAGLFSFFNAGSATNQSNHMYKLGPVHQGILERGCKTGSGSYLLWPARAGAFSAIRGKHYSNFDTSDFPFSYIDIDKGKSTLIPGMNFLTVGILRDARKWPKRDRRLEGHKQDLINFEVLSPYTAQKMLRGQQIMTELYDSSPKTQESIIYQGIHIRRLLLKTCRRYYQMALDIYWGEILLRRLERWSQNENRIEIFLEPEPQGEAGTGEWVDIAGLLVRQSRLERLIKAIEAQELDDIFAVNHGLLQCYNAYSIDEWNWFLTTQEALLGNQLTLENVLMMLGKWKTTSKKYYNLVRNDARKEFEGPVRTGFGIDGNSDKDFAAVRGDFEHNDFVQWVTRQADLLDERCQKAINQLQIG